MSNLEEEDPETDEERRREANIVGLKVICDDLGAKYRIPDSHGDR